MKFVCFLLALAACHFNQPSTPQVAESATFEMVTPGGGQCTAWAVDENHLVTAGHCCDEAGAYFAYQTGRGWHTSYVVAHQDVDFEDQDPLDVCLLHSEKPFATWLELATEMPAPGTAMAFVGYPKGEWVHSKGVFVGDVDGPYQFWNNYAATAPCDRGASGSAMFTDAGVYGVLVRLMFTGDQVLPGEMGCVATPLNQIQDILKHRQP